LTVIFVDADNDQMLNAENASWKCLWYYSSWEKKSTEEAKPPAAKANRKSALTDSYKFFTELMHF